MKILVGAHGSSGAASGASSSTGSNAGRAETPFLGSAGANAHRTPFFLVVAVFSGFGVRCWLNESRTAVFKWASSICSAGLIESRAANFRWASSSHSAGSNASRAVKSCWRLQGLLAQRRLETRTARCDSTKRRSS